MSLGKVLWMGLAVLCAAVLAGPQVWADETGSVPAKEQPAATKPAAQKPAKPAASEKPAPPDRTEAVKAQAGKLIAEGTAELTTLAETEAKVATAVMQAEAKALEKMQDKGNLLEKMEKGTSGPGLKEYRAAYMDGAAQLRLIENRYYRLKTKLATVQRDIKLLPDDLKAKLEELNGKIATQRRSNFEKMATWYETVADYKDALAVYAGIWKEIPENKRDGETTLKEKITKLQEKMGAGKNKPKTGSSDGKYTGGYGGWGG